MILKLCHSSVVPNAPLLLILPIKAPETPALSDDVKPEIFQLVHQTAFLYGASRHVYLLPPAAFFTQSLKSWHH